MKPKIKKNGPNSVRCTHEALEPFIFSVESLSTTTTGDDDSLIVAPAEWLHTDNETNYEKLFDTKNDSPFVKDAFHRYIIDGM